MSRRALLGVQGMALASLIACGGGGGSGGGGGGSASTGSATPATKAVATSGGTAQSPSPTVVAAIAGLDGGGSVVNLSSAAASSGSGGSAPTITPAIQPSRVSGVAPLSVFFDASGTTATSVERPFHDLLYVWGFGDAASGTWSQGSRAGQSSKNGAYGPVASHLYESAGTYTVTMNVTDGNEIRTQTVQIDVQDPNTVFQNNTICIASAAPFTGCPAGAAQLVTTDFASAINTYQSTKKRLLFKAGDVFTSADTAVISTSGPGMIGKFGAGASPRLNTTNTTAFFSLSQASTPNIKDWRVTDIELDGQDRDVTGVKFGGGIDQVTLLRVDIRNVSTGISNSVSLLDNWNAHANSTYHGHALWDQLAIVDSSINKINGGVAAAGLIGVFVSGTRHTLMGSSIDPAYGGEHAVRNPYLDRAIFGNNYMARPPNGKHSWTLRGPDQAVVNKLVGYGMATQKIVASENTFSNNMSAWTITIAPTNTNIDERIKDVIVERNYFVAGSNVQVALLTRGTVRDLTIRSNIFNMTNSKASSTGILASGGNAVSAPESQRVKVMNNTFYRGDVSEKLTAVALGDNSSEYSIVNNLGYSPSSSQSTMVSGAIDRDLTEQRNTTDTDMRVNNPLFMSVAVGAGIPVQSDFKISTTNGKVFGAGVMAPIYLDFHGKFRKSLDFDLGGVWATN